MFTTIANFRAMFMMTVANYQNNFEGNVAQYDTNGDGALDPTEAEPIMDRIANPDVRRWISEGDSFLLESIQLTAEIAKYQHNETLIASGVSGARLDGVRKPEISISGETIDMTNLPKNHTKAAKALQQKLVDAGVMQRYSSINNYDNVDGIIGKGTKEVIRLYNSKIGGSSLYKQEVAKHAPVKVNNQNESMESARRGKINYPPSGDVETKALQTLIGTDPDGVFGPNSRRMLQTFLNRKLALNLAPDGKIGRQTKAAINRYNAGNVSREVHSGDNQIIDNRVERGNPFAFQTKGELITWLQNKESVWGDLQHDQDMASLASKVAGVTDNTSYKELFEIATEFRKLGEKIAKRDNTWLGKLGKKLESALSNAFGLKAGDDAQAYKNNAGAVESSLTSIFKQEVIRNTKDPKKAEVLINPESFIYRLRDFTDNKELIKPIQNAWENKDSKQLASYLDYIHIDNLKTSEGLEKVSVKGQRFGTPLSEAFVRAQQEGVGLGDIYAKESPDGKRSSLSFMAKVLRGGEGISGMSSEKLKRILNEGTNLDPSGIALEGWKNYGKDGNFKTITSMEGTAFKYTEKFYDNVNGVNVKKTYYIVLKENCANIQGLSYESQIIEGVEQPQKETLKYSISSPGGGGRDTDNSVSRGTTPGGSGSAGTSGGGVSSGGSGSTSTSQGGF